MEIIKPDEYAKVKFEELKRIVYAAVEKETGRKAISVVFNDNMDVTAKLGEAIPQKPFVAAPSFVSASIKLPVPGWFSSRGLMEAEKLVDKLKLGMSRSELEANVRQTLFEMLRLGFEAYPAQMQNDYNAALQNNQGYSADARL